MTDDKYHWVGKIQTASGVAFDVARPWRSPIHFDDVCTALSHICRFNGHVPTFYSVAEHSVRVAEYLEQHGESPEVILTGLLHDASEAYVGDMVRPLKLTDDLGATFSTYEERVARELHLQLGGLYPHPEVVHEADKAIYEWEVEYIRSGVVQGWMPHSARLHFSAAWARYRHATPSVA